MASGQSNNFQNAPHRNGNDQNSVESLSEVFHCFICMKKLRNARLCPHCSKMCCYACIKKQLTETIMQCPHCKSSLHINELVNCRWAEDFAQQLDLLQHTIIPQKKSRETDQCSEHGEKIDVFCVTCNQCICHHCAIWGCKHSGHVFKSVDSEYDEHICKITDELSLLKRRNIELISLVQDVERNIESVKTAKDERVREIRNAVELMIARLESQLKSKLVTLMGQRDQVTQETELLDSLIQKIENQIEHSSKLDFINRYDELLAIFKKMHRKPMASFVTAPVPTDFTSEIVPPYDSSTFVMNRFSALQQRADPIYSQPLHVNGLSWRLKVYPDGNGVVRGNYLSVFLELSAGLPETSKYEYRVEMVHQASRDSSKNIVREFASDFEVGECWGYNRFFRLDLLATEGYLNTDSDSLTLRFQVRPPTFYQKCRDLQWYLHQVEASNSQYLAKYNELKENITLEILRNKHSNKKGSSRDSPISLMDDQVVDNIYSKYCQGDQPVNEGGSEIEIERSEEDDTDSTDSETTDGSVALSQGDLLSLSHNEDELEYSVLEENDVDEENMCLDNDVENSIIVEGVNNNLDRDTGSSNPVLCCAMNILEQNCARSDDENMLLQFLQDTDANNQRPHRTRPNRPTVVSDIELFNMDHGFYMPRPPATLPSPSSSSALTAAAPMSPKSMASKSSKHVLRSSDKHSDNGQSSTFDSFRDLKARLDQLKEKDTLGHLNAQFNELAATTFNTLAAANAAVCSEKDAKARATAEKNENKKSGAIATVSSPKVWDDSNYKSRRRKETDKSPRRAHSMGALINQEKHHSLHLTDLSLEEGPLSDNDFTLDPSLESGLLVDMDNFPSFTITLGDNYGDKSDKAESRHSLHMADLSLEEGPLSDVDTTLDMAAVGSDLQPNKASFSSFKMSVDNTGVDNSDKGSRVRSRWSDRPKCDKNKENTKTKDEKTDMVGGDDGSQEITTSASSDKVKDGCDDVNSSAAAEPQVDAKTSRKDDLKDSPAV